MGNRMYLKCRECGNMVELAHMVRGSLVEIASGELPEWQSSCREKNLSDFMRDHSCCVDGMGSVCCAPFTLAYCDLGDNKQVRVEECD